MHRLKVTVLKTLQQHCNLKRINAIVHSNMKLSIRIFPMKITIANTIGCSSSFESIVLCLAEKANTKRQTSKMPKRVLIYNSFSEIFDILFYSVKAVYMLYRSYDNNLSRE